MWGHPQKLAGKAPKLDPGSSMFGRSPAKLGLGTATNESGAKKARNAPKISPVGKIKIHVVAMVRSRPRWIKEWLSTDGAMW